jgi:hypothetical protein
MAISVCRRRGVDGRVKPGHDEKVRRAQSMKGRNNGQRYTSRQKRPDLIGVGEREPERV